MQEHRMRAGATLLGALVGLLGDTAHHAIAAGEAAAAAVSGKKQHTGGRKAYRPTLRLTSSDDYIRRESGMIVRRRPKRDKSMSARQWKKHVKAQRREANAKCEAQ